MSLSTFNPADLIQGLVPMLKRLIGECIDLQIRLAPDAGQVRADPAQIKRVILNLVVNARDGMREGGRLTIRVDRRTLETTSHSTVPAGTYVELTVENSGHDGNKEALRRLFEPLFPTKELGSRTGLGLSTAYGMLKQNGGFITVFSEPGKGSAVHVFLPVADAPVPRADTPPPSRAPTSGGESILLVEDESAIRKLSEMVLRKAAYRVTSAATAAEALALAPGVSDLRLLVTDVVMPGMNGVELYRALVKTHPHVRVLYVSGYTADALTDVHLSVGSSFLSKPFSPQDLLAAVRRALDTTA